MATDRLGDIRLFVEAATLGGLSAAGRKLGLSPAAASARLLKLESDLQTRLFDRTTRQLRLTNEGSLYLQHCRTALQAIDDGAMALQAAQNVVQGKVRISASTDFGRNVLAEWLDEFVSIHPDIRIALSLSDSLANLTQDNLDLAIRFGLPREDSLASRWLAPNWRVLCASPDYLTRHGEPKTPEDLIAHQFVALTTAAGPLNELEFIADDKKHRFAIPLENAWETDDGALARAWSAAGYGITRKTIWDAAADLRSGALKIVLPGTSIEEAGVYAVFHQTKYMAARVRSLLDFLTEKFTGATAQLHRDVERPQRLDPKNLGHMDQRRHGDAWP